MMDMSKSEFLILCEKLDAIINLLKEIETYTATISIEVQDEDND